MRHTIYINLDFLYDEGQIKLNYPFTVEENISDISRYLFEKKYHKKYDELGWYLEPGAKAFIKDLEDRWLRNQIDTFDLYELNFNFRDWLKEYYTTDAIRACTRELDELNYETVSENDFIGSYYEAFE